MPLTICECPSVVTYDELPIKPQQKTPIDKLGYREKCCGSIPLQIASIFICILSFVWAIFEIQNAEKFMLRLFPKKGEAFKYFKVVYLLWALSFLILSAILMLGLTIRKFQLLLVYVWGAFVFLCMYVALTIVAVVSSAFRGGNLARKDVIMTVASFVWSVFFLYLLMVVNSYKIVLW